MNKSELSQRLVFLDLIIFTGSSSKLQHLFIFLQIHLLLVHVLLPMLQDMSLSIKIMRVYPDLN